MTTITRNRQAFRSTSYAGHFSDAVTYPDLVKIFGEPHYEASGDDKTDFEWELDVDGMITTIYNYKTGPAYAGAEGIPVEDHRGEDLHIGGDSEAFYKLIAYVAEKLAVDNPIRT